LKEPINILLCDTRLLTLNELSDFYEELPEIVKNKIDLKRVEDDKIVRIMGYYLLMQLINCKALQITLSDRGKPECKWLIFNLSYSNGTIALIYSKDMSLELGIDLEKIEKIAISNYINAFHPEEEKEILNSLDSNDTFFSIWTKKEALLKAKGIGILEGISAFSVLENVIEIQDIKWFCSEIDYKNKWKVAICSNKDFSERKVNINTVSGELETICTELEKIVSFELKQ
jgi:4'-phosphopantetheinyl transferase